MKTWGASVFLVAGLAIAQAPPTLQDVQSAINRKDYATALRIVRPLADKGDPAAEFILGTMYALGLGVSRSYSEALIWFRKSADLGHPGAQSNLGSMYARGEGVKQDPAQAVQWYRKAAEQG